MAVTLEQLTHENFRDAQRIDRDDIPEAWVDTAAALLETTDYGAAHHLLGHTYLARMDGVPEKSWKTPSVRCTGSLESVLWRWGFTGITPGPARSISGTAFIPRAYMKAATNTICGSSRRTEELK